MRAFVIVLVGLFLVGNAHAASKQMTPQQQKMATCSTAAKGKKGAEYKQAVSDCMKQDVATAPAAPLTQQQKMTACSKANKGKKGDEYKQAMSACLAQ